MVDLNICGAILEFVAVAAAAPAIKHLTAFSSTIATTTLLYVGEKSVPVPGSRFLLQFPIGTTTSFHTTYR